MPIEQVNVNKPSAFVRCVHVLHWRRVQDEFPSEECVRYVAISGREYLGCGNSSAILCKMHRSSHLEFALKMPKSSSYLQTVSQSHLIIFIYMIEDWLVVWNSFFFKKKNILGISPSQLTNSYFSEGRSTINQLSRHGRITREERWSMGPREFEGLTGLWSSGATSNLRRWSPVSCNQVVLDHTSIPGVWRSGLHIAAYKAAMILPFDPFFTEELSKPNSFKSWCFAPWEKQKPYSCSQKPCFQKQSTEAFTMLCTLIKWKYLVCSPLMFPLSVCVWVSIIFGQGHFHVSLQFYSLSWQNHNSCPFLWFYDSYPTCAGKTTISHA